VSLLRQEAEIPRTEDGSVFLEELQAVFEELEVDPRVRDMLTGLLAKQVDSPRPELISGIPDADEVVIRSHRSC
jgi:hypothetical protein